MESLQKIFIKYRSFFLILSIGAVLLSIHIPFYLAHRVEDDAYISFTCGKNLADTGVLGFNRGEKISVCTSHLYVFVIAASRLIFANFFVSAVMSFDLLIFLYSLYILSSLFFIDLKRRLILWTVSSLLPVSLLITDKGMETPILIFLIVIVLKWIYTQKANFLTYAALFLIPFVRPDWAVFIFLPVLFLFIKNKKINWKIFFSSICGTLSFFLFNKLYFGTFLNQSIIAKSQLITKTSFLPLLGKVFFSNDFGIFVPLNISSLYIRHFVLLALFYFAGISFFAVFVYIIFKIFKSADMPLKNILMAMATLIFFVPALYAFGGVIFSWYLLPSSLFAYFLVIFGAIIFAGTLDQKYKRIGIFIGTLLIFLLMAGQLLIDVYGGSLNYYYYSSIGKYIKSVSSVSDSIMLEPLGVIPFFAERYTHDEAGLASTAVAGYWKRYNYSSQWWINYVKDQKPTFLIERSVDAYGLSKEEKKWFNDNYYLIKEFRYNPADYPSVEFINKFISRVFKMGSNSSFSIYKKI